MRRSLDDFGLLRTQLIIEHSYACIPDLRELFGNSKWINENITSQNGVKLIRKIVQRLDLFLKYLLTNSELSSHELVHEFLVIPQMETDMIVARTQMKVEYIHDLARKEYESFVHELSKKLERWEDEDLKLILRQNLLRTVGLGVRKLGRAHGELVYHWKTVSYLITKPVLRLINNRLAVKDGFNVLISALDGTVIKPLIKE